jgi:hypothetical protein
MEGEAKKIGLVGDSAAPTSARRTETQSVSDSLQETAVERALAQATGFALGAGSQVSVKRGYSLEYSGPKNMQTLVQVWKQLWKWR